MQGHEKNWEVLTKVNPNLCPFLIFYGEQGIGKSFFAQEFAAFILNKDLSCGVHHNYRYLNFGEAEIKVDILPTIKDFLEHRYGEYKVLIIDNADHLNTYASNSLLKLFEKEYEKTFVILIVHNIHKFPETVKSRFMKIPFEGEIDPENPLSIYTQGNFGLLNWVEKQGGMIFIEDLKNLMSARVLGDEHEVFIKKYKDDSTKILQLMRIILFLDQKTKAFEKLNQFLIRSEHTHIPIEDTLYMSFCLSSQA